MDVRVPVAGIPAAVVAAAMAGGPRLNSDALHYIAFSDSGATATGGQFLWWPPLYPAVVAVWTPVAVVVVAAVSVGAIALAVYELCRRSGVARWACVSAGLLAGAGFQTVYLGSWVRTEVMFTALALWCCIKVADGDLVQAGVLASAASLTRYSGVVCIAVGVAVLMWDRDRRWWSWGAAVSAPLAVWLARNLLLSGTLAGHRAAPLVGVDTNVVAAGHAAAGWLVMGLPAAVAVVWVLAACAVQGRTATIATVWAAGYVAVLVGAASVVGMDPIGWRLMYPAFPVAIVAAVVAVSRLQVRTAVVGVVAMMAVGQVDAHAEVPVLTSERVHGSVSPVMDARLRTCAPDTWRCVD